MDITFYTIYMCSTIAMGYLYLAANPLSSKCGKCPILSILTSVAGVDSCFNFFITDVDGVGELLGDETGEFSGHPRFVGGAL